MHKLITLTLAALLAGCATRNKETTAMPTLVQFEFKQLPAVRVVGKEIAANHNDIMAGNNNLPAFWQQCFDDNTFATLEALGDAIYDDAYVGYISNFDPATGNFSYICGMLMNPGTTAPEGFTARDIAPAKAAVAWIKGTIPDVFSAAHDFTMKAMEERGATPDGPWCMELYNCPRFTQPDADGNVILDYYIPCK